MRTIDDILRDQQAIIDAASGRTMTTDEMDRYEALEAELKNAQRAQNIHLQHAANNAAAGGRPFNGAPAFVPDANKKTGYDAAFDAYLRTGKVNADLERARNAQSEGVPSEGGYLVPTTFRDQLIEQLKAFGGIGAEAERYTTGDGRPVEWPTINDTSNQGEIVQEGNTFSGGADLVFDTNSLGSYSYMTGGASGTPLRVSFELTQDSAFDLQGLITRLFGLRIGRLQAVHLATGSGSGQPLGLVTGRTAVTTAANTAVTWDDFVHWKHSLDPAYRDPSSCIWVMNDSTLEIVEKIKNTAGDPLLLTGGQGNQRDPADVDRILGYRVRIDQAMPTFAANNPSNLPIVFGNVRRGYVIRDIKDVSLLVDPYGRMHNRQVQYSAWARMDATQQDTNAYIVGTGHA